MGTRLTASALEAVVDGILQCYGYLPPKEKQKLQVRLKKRSGHKKAPPAGGSDPSVAKDNLSASIMGEKERFVNAGF